MIIDNKRFNQIFCRVADDFKNTLLHISKEHPRAGVDMSIYENYYLLRIRDACFEMINFLKKDSVFLDFANGVSLVPAVLSQLVGSVYACDILKEDWNLKWWEEMSKKYNYCQYIISREENIPHSDNYFDVVCLYAVLEHIGSSEKEVFAKIPMFHRVLKKGGHIFVFNTPQRFSYIENLERIFNISSHKVLLTPSLAKQNFLKNGFKIIKFEQYGILPDYWPIDFISKFHNSKAEVYNKLDKILSRLPVLNFLTHDLLCILEKR